MILSDKLVELTNITSILETDLNFDSTQIKIKLTDKEFDELQDFFNVKSETKNLITVISNTTFEFYISD